MICFSGISLNSNLSIFSESELILIVLNASDVFPPTLILASIQYSPFS